MSKEYISPKFFAERAYQFGCQAIAENDWKGINAAFYFDASTGIALLEKFADQLPLEFCCKAALAHYTDRGDGYTMIRNLVRQAKCVRPENWREELPEAVRNNTVFTVYRAGSETLAEAKDVLSWTIFRDVAEWFVDSKLELGLGAQHLYRGEIDAEDVIAFLNGRSEFEILNSGTVRNIVEITPVGVPDAYMELQDLGLDYDTAEESHKELVALFNRRMMEADRETA